ncbi:MAG: hypothetical protein RLO37_04820 [Coleofasciculus chthonoplastes F1-TOW-03]
MKSTPSNAYFPSNFLIASFPQTDPVGGFLRSPPKVLASISIAMG